MKVPRAVIFDLDGTLLDTLEGIADTANAVLEEKGFPTHPREAYRTFAGDGVGELLARALPPEKGNPALVQECVQSFKEGYARFWPTSSRPYEGIPELLDELVARELPICVLSNKLHAFTVQFVDRLLAKWSFAFVVGQREGVPRKPDPTSALQMAADLHLSPSEILYLGDTNTDMQTAVSAGMMPLGVTWGFREKPELLASGAAQVVSHPGEVSSFFEQ
ncbi:MAG: HAD family hydrolase [Verrucomicrobiota bacterium]